MSSPDNQDPPEQPTKTVHLTDPEEMRKLRETSQPVSFEVFLRQVQAGIAMSQEEPEKPTKGDS